MNDDPIENLARFTPAASGLDRDELLFQAGRASVRPGHFWRAAAAVLAASQLLTLAAWLGTGRPVVAPVTPVAPATEPPPPPPAPPVFSPPAVDPSSYLALSRRWEGEPPPLAVTPGPAGGVPSVPLTAGWRGDPLN